MPESSLVDLRPGEVAGLTIDWDNWCDPLIKGKPRTPPTAVRVTLPHGAGSMDADYNGVPGCIEPDKPSSIGVSSFEPGKVPKTKPWTGATLRASIPNQPVRGKRGGVLRYTVVLKNVSDKTASFDRCPAYAQQLVPDGHVEVYRLNCARARPIAPGESEAFEMHIKVPQANLVGAKRPVLGARPVQQQGAAAPRAGHRRLLRPGPRGAGVEEPPRPVTGPRPSRRDARRTASRQVPWSADPRTLRAMRLGVCALACFVLLATAGGASGAQQAPSWRRRILEPPARPDRDRGGALPRRVRDAAPCSSRPTAARRGSPC